MYARARVHVSGRAVKIAGLIHCKLRRAVQIAIGTVTESFVRSGVLTFRKRFALITDVKGSLYAPGVTAIHEITRFSDAGAALSDSISFVRGSVNRKARIGMTRKTIGRAEGFRARFLLRTRFIPGDRVA